MGMIGGTASVELDKPIEEVYAFLEDVEKAPEWQGGMKTMKTLERDGEGRTLVAETTADAKVKEVTTKVRFSYTSPTEVAWSQEKGDLKKLDGAWRLEDLGGGRTKVTYWLEGDPGRMLGMLIRGPVEGQIRAHLVESRPGELEQAIG
jgi:ribosome-associated toxin RatA of RatAB toxin-antitoxin module